MSSTLGNGNITFGDGSIQTSAGLGYGQTWQAVVRDITNTVTYYNTTGRPIVLHINCGRAGPSTSGIAVTVQGVGFNIAYNTNSSGGNTACGSVIIPVGGDYRLAVSSESLSSFNAWELR